MGWTLMGKAPARRNDGCVQMKRPKIETVSALLGGAAAGALLAFLALELAGAGHGWVSQGVSVVGSIAAPLASVAWVRRGERWSRRLAGCLLILGVTLDVAIVIMTQLEGWRYPAEAWRRVPLGVLAWLTLWIGWQALAGVQFVSPKGS